MYSGGNVTLMVADMDASVRFYTEVLGLKLAYRFGNHWASIHAGKGLTIGLHPGKPNTAVPGDSSVSIGLELEGSIDDAVSKLEARGVQFAGPVSRDKAGSFAHFHDPDGHTIYLAQLNWSHVNQGEGEYTHA